MALVKRLAVVVLVVGWVVGVAAVADAKGLLPAGGGGGGYCYEPPPQMDARWVAVGDNCFSPQTMEIATGETVRWQPAGQGTHDVTFDPGPSSASIPPDGYAITFRAPGTYDYSCSIHPGMTGTILAAGDTLSGPALEVLGAGAGTSPSGSRAASPPTTSILRDSLPMRLEFSPLTSVVLLTIGLPLSLSLAARLVGFGPATVRPPRPRRSSVRR